jgi:uridine kinase
MRVSPGNVATEAVRLAKRGVVMVALDGFSGSGKTTLAHQLALDIGSAAIVTGDDFYRVMDEGQRWDLSPEEGMTLYFDWERLRDEALVPLGSGMPARYRPYDWQAGAGLDKRNVDVQPAAVIVVDGVYSARPELSCFVDLAVFVDTSLAVRQQRLAQRGHGNDHWNVRWDAAERHYFSRVRPPESFDLVVSGDWREPA